jgi:2-dehydro-3-deoxygluconokinase/2-dehydro-3-deoxygalactonokinase
VVALLDFISLGEVLIQLNALSPGPLRYAKYFEVHVAGSEANTLVGLRKLGYSCGFISRVGDDEFGMMILNVLRGEGVDISRVKVDVEAPTGLYFIQRHFPIPGKSTVFYYRSGSAASRMNVEDVDEEYIEGSKALFITGITPALSRSCFEAVDKAYEVAIKNNVDVIFDTNIRKKLWKKIEDCRVLAKYFKAKIISTNIEDLEVFFPNLPLVDAAKKVMEKGSEIVVVKLGEEGSLAVTKDRVYKCKPYKVIVEDPIGAGDAFNAVFIASYYKNIQIEEALDYANAAGALVTTVRGDIEAQPTWKDLETFIQSKGKAVLLR